MGRFASGKYAKAISDRSGLEFPYTEMVKEWNGSFVHISEYEEKQPQLQPRAKSADPQGLNRARPDRTEPATPNLLPASELPGVKYKVIVILSINLCTKYCDGVPVAVLFDKA